MAATIIGQKFMPGERVRLKNSPDEEKGGYTVERVYWIDSPAAPHFRVTAVDHSLWWCPSVDAWQDHFEREG